MSLSQCENLNGKSLFEVGWLKVQFAYSTFFTGAPIPKVNRGNEITETNSTSKKSKTVSPESKK